MKKLILLLSCLVLAGGQTLSLAASANFFSIKPFNDDRAISAATSFINTTNDGMDSAADGAKPNTNTGTRSSNNAKEARQANGYLNIEKGNLLLSPDVDLCVGTPQANIYIAAGATVFVMESGEDLILYDLYQKRAKQISVIIDKVKLVMSPGRMLVLTRENTRNFAKLEANCRSVNYRHPQLVNLDNADLKVFVADFSILSALARIQPLKRLTASNDKQDRLVLEKILRSALVLASFASTSSPFVCGSMNR